MTNAELVLRYQAGDVNALFPLWQQTQRYITQQAARVIRSGARGVELADLEQAGFLAMAEAAATHDPEKAGSFLTWLTYYLKSYFAAATGHRTTRRDALNSAVSLEMPVGEDVEDGTLADCIPDPRAAAELENVEQKVWNEQLHKALAEALIRLSERERQTIEQRYYNGLTLAEIGAQQGISGNAVRQTEAQAMRKLRHSSTTVQLESFLDSRTKFDYRVNVDQFNRTHTSAVEEIVFNREKLRRIYAV